MILTVSANLLKYFTTTPQQRQKTTLHHQSALFLGIRAEWRRTAALYIQRRFFISDFSIERQYSAKTFYQAGCRPAPSGWLSTSGVKSAGGKPFPPSRPAVIVTRFETCARHPMAHWQRPLPVGQTCPRPCRCCPARQGRVGPHALVRPLHRPDRTFAATCRHSVRVLAWPPRPRDAGPGHFPGSGVRYQPALRRRNDPVRALSPFPGRKGPTPS